MKKQLRSILIGLSLLWIFSGAAFAAELQLSAEKTQVEVGDEVVLSLLVKEENIAAAEGSFSYDPSLLSYVSGTGGASDGYFSLLSLKKGGSEYLTAVIRFTAVKKGEVVVSSVLNSAYSYDGTSLDFNEDSADVLITIQGEDELPGSATPPSARPDYSKTGVLAENVEAATEPMYIRRSLQDLTLPSGYADRQVEYKGGFVGGAAIPATDMPILLYLSTASGELGSYYVYDEARDFLYPYETVTSVLATYTFIRPDESVEIPEGFEPLDMAISDVESIPVWKNPDMEIEYYLVYLRDSGGDVGFYLYDREERSVQRYLLPAAAEEPLPGGIEEDIPPEDPSPLHISLTKPVFFLLSAGCGILLLAFIGLLIFHIVSKRNLEEKYRRKIRRLRSAQRERDLEE